MFNQADHAHKQTQLAIVSKLNNMFEGSLRIRQGHMIMFHKLS